MCLSVVNKIRKVPTKSVKVGLKRFHLGGLGLSLKYQFTNQNLNGTSTVPRGKWLRKQGSGELSSYIKNGVRRSYSKGFHIFTNTKAASNYYHYSNQTKTVKVLYKQVVTEGRQSYSGGRKDTNTVVANYMYVPAENEKIVGTKIVKIKAKKQ